MKSNDFTGKNIYVGIDVHLKRWVITIIVVDLFHKTFSIDADVDGLYDYLSRNFPNGNYKSVYEAGYFGFGTHRALMNLGVENIVINPADVPTTAKEKTRKSDKVDSKKLAQCLRNGTLSGIFVPDEDEEADRELVRFRISKIRKEVTRAKQRLSSFLSLKGIRSDRFAPNAKTKWTKEYITGIEQFQMPKQSDQYVLEGLLLNLNQKLELRRDITRKIFKLSHTPKYEELTTRLQTIPGVGLLTSMTLATEIISMGRFKNLSRLCSYMGLVPDTAQSADSVKVKGMTKRTNFDVRRILIQASWIAAMRNSKLSLKYSDWKIANGGNGQKAIIKVAKRLLSIIRNIWLNKTKFDPTIS